MEMLGSRYLGIRIEHDPVQTGCCPTRNRTEIGRSRSNRRMGVDGFIAKFTMH